MSKAKCIMVQGTMSGAGKSLLCAALCRIFAQDGYRVAPFKSQNMALNSFVTRNGAEMGRAQVVQAQAAGVEPDVRMNPILLKPSSDVGSQVIVNGKARGQMPAAAYFKMKRSLIPDILEAYNSLAAENDIIVIEGAGSPAEINLKADDIVNMGLAKLVDAPVLIYSGTRQKTPEFPLWGTLVQHITPPRPVAAGCGVLSASNRLSTPVRKKCIFSRKKFVQPVRSVLVRTCTAHFERIKRFIVCILLICTPYEPYRLDRKSTRLNSSH